MPWWAWILAFSASHFVVFWLGFFVAAALAAGKRADEMAQMPP